VDTTTGSLCSIDTAKNVEMYEKNSVPSTTDKQVKADGDDAYADSVNGIVGQKFNFQITVNTGTNTEYNEEDNLAVTTRIIS
jgi:hypothetical protein